MGGATTGAPRALDLRGAFNGSSRPRSSTRGPPPHTLSPRCPPDAGSGTEMDGAARLLLGNGGEDVKR
jgi:hypothetical protein